MALIEWRSDFETGIADVDHEHRELIELINKLHEQLVGEETSEVITDFLGEVFAQVSAHFALEESMMRKHNYDQYDDHKTHHEKLLDDIRDIMDDHEAGDYTTYGESLSAVIHNWFVDHFQTRDARLHKMLGV